jgi:hypothetical protein
VLTLCGMSFVFQSELCQRYQLLLPCNLLGFADKFSFEGQKILIREKKEVNFHSLIKSKILFEALNLTKSKFELV